jgi:hypothetical protein
MSQNKPSTEQEKAFDVLTSLITEKGVKKIYLATVMNISKPTFLTRMKLKNFTDEELSKLRLNGYLN